MLLDTPNGRAVRLLRKSNVDQSIGAISAEVFLATQNTRLRRAQITRGALENEHLSGVLLTDEPSP